jgi:hypothetical protein
MLPSNLTGLSQTITQTGPLTSPEQVRYLGWSVVLSQQPFWPPRVLARPEPAYYWPDALASRRFGHGAQAGRCQRRAAGNQNTEGGASMFAFTARLAAGAIGPSYGGSDYVRT